MELDPKSSIDAVLKHCGTDPKNGLSQQAAEKRLTEEGKNFLEEKKVSLWKKFFSFFWGPIPWMIELAALLSGFLERWPDFILILSLLCINALLGFFHEYKADSAIEALKNKLAPKARVLRDGKWNEIAAENLVVGDIISLKGGSITPADVKLMEGEYLSVDQSALTGESMPVDKQKQDIAYSSSIVKQGEMTAIVIATGMHTYFGKTAKLVETAAAKSHFQVAIVHIGRFLILFTLLVAATVFIVSLFRIYDLNSLHLNMASIAIFLLVLIVAGIPVALPAVLSVTMAIGADKMAKLKAILSKLLAIEELAGMDILCSDKTGTLTKNELTVKEIQPFGGFSEKDLSLLASLASKQESDDPIDQAIISVYPDKESLSSFTCKEFTPFDPVHKKTEALIEDNKSKRFRVTKGAPQVMLALSHPSYQKEVEDKVEELAQRGFRTLGVAKGTEDGKNWEFIGLIPLFDPPREETKETIAEVKKMGVQVKMVTGDHSSIAKEMAKKLDLGSNITPMQDLKDERGSHHEMEKALESTDGFAEVFPEDKYTIVKTFQSEEHIVGMTGDGVNDAPALKQADIGIAVDNATDAARAAADLILTEPGLSVIQKAIEEARKIFGRMKSYAIYRISETCRLLLFLLLSMLILDAQPLTAIMIILIALLNDLPIMMIAYDKMKIDPKPVIWDMKEIFFVAFGLSIVGVLSTFVLYWIGDRVFLFSVDQCRTLAFFAILCGGNLTIYLTRNRTFPFSQPFPEIKFFLATLFSQIVGTLFTVYGIGNDSLVGIGWSAVGYGWLYILVWFCICAFTKKLIYHYLEKNQTFTSLSSSCLRHAE